MGHVEVMAALFQFIEEAERDFLVAIGKREEEDFTRFQVEHIGIPGRVLAGTDVLAAKSPVHPDKKCRTIAKH